ncbi:MAG: histidinol dehydrogenase [Cellvibrionales bacterium]|nr:histidinol dehydrogenase [Cellvibrionales bacterium]
MMRKLNTQDDSFQKELAALVAFSEETSQSVEATVRDILHQVQTTGDHAVLEFTQRFDRLAAQSMAELRVTSDEIQAAKAQVSEAILSSLRIAADRIKSYHEHQKQNSWQYEEADGTVLGQKITPLDRVGIYVPGGKASYPSTVLMNAIPAKVAGVKEIVMVVPAPDNELNPMVLAAADIAGVTKIFKIGGAQAVAALAYGTESVPKVDKIVGPGNIFVATAKRQVFGLVGLDMIAGPSEILVICDGKTNPDWIAMDLFSQAEHDENAQAILISPDADFLQAVEQSIGKLLPTMKRADLINASLTGRGAFIQVASLDEAAQISNQIAPEHLELSVEDPESLCEKITHAGAIFMGRYTSEALGDYCAGPNHVLPTSSTAKFSSPLGVYDFQKRSSIIYCSESSASELGKVASQLAEGESLEAHARSASLRVKS